MKMLTDWFDDRTGYKKLLHEALYENIPGGSRWRYVWGSTLVFTFTVQVITGIFLWMCYSPSSRTAWESVYYIQYEMQGGWLLRGVHHFTAHAMIILLALHLVQVVIDGAYKAPREVNFWLGLILMQIVLALSLTGYLLPWDQKGFWATNVATNLMVLVPWVGPDLQKLVVGGPTYGHATLTRFFALHAGVLPGALIALLALHIAIFRRHGICAANPKRGPDQKFWPDQVLKDVVACLVVLAAILFFVVRGALTTHNSLEPVQSHMGAELGAPADLSTPYSAARPEWYFLFLFQFLKYFKGESEIFGAIIIPGLVMLALFFMPLVGRWKLGHGFNVGLIAALGMGIAFLTFSAIQEDRSNPQYGEAVELAEINRVRAIELAKAPQGIPDSGVVSLLRSDPKTQGPILFTRHCASCHTHVPMNGEDHESEDQRADESIKSTAPNLYGFATRSWIAGLLDPKGIVSSDHFGNTKHKDRDDGQGMVEWVQTNLSTDDLDDKEKAKLRENLDKLVVALSAQAKLRVQSEMDAIAKQDGTIEQGIELLESEFSCTDCHQFHGHGAEPDPDLNAPDLTNYGSRQWTIDFISNASHERFYGGNNDRMPAYAKNPSDPKNNVLIQHELEMIVDWLRGDWYQPAAGVEAQR